MVLIYFGFLFSNQILQTQILYRVNSSTLSNGEYLVLLFLFYFFLFCWLLSSWHSHGHFNYVVIGLDGPRKLTPGSLLRTSKQFLILLMILRLGTPSFLHQVFTFFFTLPTPTTKDISNSKAYASKIQSFCFLSMYAYDSNNKYACPKRLETCIALLNHHLISLTQLH